MVHKAPCQTGYRCIWGQPLNEWASRIRCSLPVCVVTRHADGYTDTIQQRRVVYRVREEASTDEANA